MPRRASTRGPRRPSAARPAAESTPLWLATASVRERPGPGLDQLLALVDRLAVLGGHLPQRLRDESGDQARAEAAAAGRGCRCLLDPVPKHCGDVVSIVECVLADDARNQLLEVVVVGLSPAEGRGERPEGARLDDRFVLLRREAGSPQEFHEAVALGVCRKGLEFGGEAVDAAMDCVLGLHRLVRGHARAAVLEHPEEHGASRDVIRLGSRVAVVRLVESDVGDVRLPAAAHGDVEVLPGRRRCDDDVGGVDGDALGPMCGDGVAEVDVLADVLRWQHRLSPTSRIEPVDQHRAVAADVDHAPAVTVLDPAAAGGPEGALVASGDDHISDRGAVAGGQWDLTTIDSAVEQEPFGAGPLVQSSHGVG